MHLTVESAGRSMKAPEYTHGARTAHSTPSDGIDIPTFAILKNVTEIILPESAEYPVQKTTCCLEFLPMGCNSWTLWVAGLGCR